MSILDEKFISPLRDYFKEKRSPLPEVPSSPEQIVQKRMHDRAQSTINDCLPTFTLNPSPIVGEDWILVDPNVHLEDWGAPQTAPQNLEPAAKLEGNDITTINQPKILTWTKSFELNPAYQVESSRKYPLSLTLSVRSDRDGSLRDFIILEAQNSQPPIGVEFIKSVKAMRIQELSGEYTKRTSITISDAGGKETKISFSDHPGEGLTIYPEETEAERNSRNNVNATVGQQSILDLAKSLARIACDRDPVEPWEFANLMLSKINIPADPTVTGASAKQKEMAEMAAASGLKGVTGFDQFRSQLSMLFYELGSLRLGTGPNTGERFGTYSSASLLGEIIRDLHIESVKPILLESDRFTVSGEDVRLAAKTDSRPGHLPDALLTYYREHANSRYRWSHGQIAYVPQDPYVTHQGFKTEQAVDGVKKTIILNNGAKLTLGVDATVNNQGQGDKNTKVITCEPPEGFDTNIAAITLIIRNVGGFKTTHVAILPKNSRSQLEITSTVNTRSSNEEVEPPAQRQSEALFNNATALKPELWTELFGSQLNELEKYSLSLSGDKDRQKKVEVKRAELLTQQRMRAIQAQSQSKLEEIAIQFKNITAKEIEVVAMNIIRDFIGSD